MGSFFGVDVRSEFRVAVVRSISLVILVRVIWVEVTVSTSCSADCSDCWSDRFSSSLDTIWQVQISFFSCSSLTRLLTRLMSMVWIFSFVISNCLVLSFEEDDDDD